MMLLCLLLHLSDCAMCYHQSLRQRLTEHIWEVVLTRSAALWHSDDAVLLLLLLLLDGFALPFHNCCCRCMETLLLQRQHRHALKAKHHQLLHQQQQQQQQQPQQANSATPAFTLLSQEELAEVKIWDAFVDATLRDYLHYLEAAAAGQPSVFTTSSAALSPTGDRDSKDMQQTTAEYQDACQAMAMAADMLSWLPKQLMSRPGHLTKEQLVRLALVVQDDSTDNIVQILKHFHEVKRKAFVDVLEELLTAAGAAAAQTRGRF